MLSVLTSRSDPHLLQSLYQLRHQVFQERMGWDVKSYNGQERDQFDAANTIYLACVEGGRVLACVRLLPSLGPNMTRDVFSRLMGLPSIPAAADLWEISRFAVDTRASQATNHYVGHMTSLLVSGLQEFAFSQGLTGYIAVIDNRMERILRRTNADIHHISDAQILGQAPAFVKLFVEY